MDRLTSMRVFRAVVDEGAFARAARRLRLSNAAVSKHVAALEDALNTRLLHRTTRSLGLTPEGSAYYARATTLLDEIDALERELREGGETPRGTLRVTAPMSFGLARLAPALPAFLSAHPDVKVDLALTDRFVDVVEEGVDVAIRVARALPDGGRLTLRGDTLTLRRGEHVARTQVGSADALLAVLDERFGLRLSPGTVLRGCRVPRVAGRPEGLG